MKKHSPCGPKHIIRNAQADVSLLCEPLFKKLDLNYFHYGKLYKDGSVTIVYSRMDWHDYFYSHEFKTCVPLPNQNIVLGNYTVCLWRGAVQDEVVSAARLFTNLDHPINITVAHKDYFECFAFGARQGNDSIINTYFNNIELLINFTQTFKEQTTHLIKKIDRNNFLLPAAQRADQLKILDNISSALTLTGAYGEVKISAKELEVLRFLCRGLTSKEIASKIHRSVRTIEMHLNHLKSKLGCKSKSQLITFAFENNIM